MGLKPMIFLSPIPDQKVGAIQMHNKLINFLKILPPVSKPALSFE
jgi:hypothetical protein